MKQDLRRTDTEISSKFYNNPLISEGESKRRLLYFLKFTRSATLIEQTTITSIYLQREREREQDTMVGKGMDFSE